MTTSTPPSASRLEDALLLAAVRKRLRHSTANGILGQALAEGAVVLLGQHRGRHQHGHLLAVVDGLERGAHGQFGLAVADVAADEPVHRPRLLHVGLDLGHAS